MPPRDDLGPTIDINGDGFVCVSSEVALRKLASAAGRWRLLPAGGDLLVWQREDEGDPGAGGSGPSPGVALCGEIDGPGAVGNVLSFVNMNQWDGTLGLSAGPARKFLYFGRGQLLFATSNVPEDRLGPTLVRVGLLREEDLEQCQKDITAQKRLGNVLIERGFMTSHDLYEGVKRQAEEVFYSVLLFRRGTFFFVKNLQETALPARLVLDTQALLLEGLRRIDEMSFFRAKLPGPEVVLTRRWPPPATELGGHSKTVYNLCDDMLSLGEIARLSSLGEFATTKAAFELAQTGFIEVRQPAELRRQKPVKDKELPADFAGTILDAYNDALARLYGAVLARGKAGSLHKGVSAFVAGNARFAELFNAVELDLDGALPKDKILANLNALPASTRAELLQRGLNEFLFFVLFVAGDAIDGKEWQELRERVARALEGLPRPHAEVSTSVP